MIKNEGINVLKYVLIFFLLAFNFVYGDNLEFSNYEISSSPFRKIVLLNKNWIYKTDEVTKKLNVPFWLDEEKIVVENKFKLNEKKSFSIYVLQFEGVRGLEALYFNEERIPFDPIELEKYEFRIPSNIVKENGENVVKIILSQKLRIKEQNIFASRIELPERKSGIFKDVFLEVLPSIAITNLRLIPELDKNLSNGKINYSIEIASSKHIHSDSSKVIRLMINVLDGLTSNTVGSMAFEINYSGTSKTISGSLMIKNPTLWDIQKPFHYKLEIKLFSSQELIDQIESKTGFRRIEVNDGKFYLNNHPIYLNGVTYFESNGHKNSFFKLKEYERDLNLIKELGANAILVKNSFPSDELMTECDKNGILVFFDLDSKIYPANSFQLIEKTKKLDFVFNRYSSYANFVGLNFGFVLQEKEIKNLFELLKKSEQTNFNILKFFETSNLKILETNKFDFIGYNLLHKKIPEIEKFLSNFNEDKFLLVTAFGYNHGLEEEEGYTNPYSVQAQAKYISDVLKLLQGKNASFFVHTFADYRLPYQSIIAGKLDNTLMKTGLVNEYRDIKKLSFKVVKSYFTENKLPLIMQGNYSEKAFVVYAFAGLILLALTILSINSTHRFRENVSRAILKTYNFFSDIRDGWFISSFHSVILALNIALSVGLIYSGLFYYWKDKINFERFVSIFNSLALFELSSFLAWRPIEAIIYFTLMVALWFGILTFLVRFFNLFVRNKIFLTHSFLIVVWSAIPFLILLPLGIVIFKVLSMEKYNLLIYAILIIFHLWILMRTLKGISIVFEVKKSKVYFVSLALIVITLASLILYLQINYSSIDYLMEYFG
jgi:beta-galactosidase